MADPYSRDDIDTAQNVGGGLPLGYTLSDRLRTAQGLPLTPGVGDNSPVLPLPTSPDDYSWMNNPAAVAAWTNAYGPAGAGSGGGPSGVTEIPGVDYGGNAYEQPSAGSAMPPSWMYDQTYQGGPGGGAGSGGGPARPEAPTMPTDAGAIAVPKTPVQAALEAQFARAQQLASNPLYRLGMSLQGKNPDAPVQDLAFKLFEAQRQAESDQMAREIHKDTIAQNEIKLWEGVKQLRKDTPEDQLPAFDEYWAKQLVDRHGQSTAGTPAAGQMTQDRALALLKSGGVPEFIKNYADATDEDKKTAARIYNESAPGEGAIRADNFLKSRRDSQLVEVTRRIPGELDPVIADLTVKLGRKPTIDEVIAKTKANIAAAPDGAVRTQYGISPHLASDGLDGFADTAAGKAYFARKGLVSEGAKADIGPRPLAMATEIGQTDEWKQAKRQYGLSGVTGETLSTLSKKDGDLYDRMLVSAQKLADQHTEGVKESDRQKAAADRRQAQAETPFIQTHAGVPFVTGDAQAFQPDTKQRVSIAGLSGPEMERRQNLPPGDPQRIVVLTGTTPGKPLSDFYSRQDLRDRYAEYAKVVDQYMTKDPGIVNKTIGELRKAGGYDNLVTALDALGPSMLQEMRLVSGTARGSNAALEIVKKANVNDGMSLGQAHQVLQTGVRMLDIRDGSVFGTRTPAQREADLNRAVRNLDYSSAPATGGVRVPSRASQAGGGH